MAGRGVSGLVIAPSSQWVALASAEAGTREPPGPGAHPALAAISYGKDLSQVSTSLRTWSLATP